MPARPQPKWSLHFATVSRIVERHIDARNKTRSHALSNPDHIADAYWILHAQPRGAWTHELDLRPYMEKF